MNEILICRFKDCGKYLSQPVILPCGNNICKVHVDEIYQTSKLFKCDFCKSIHEIPENGFILNKAISDLIKSNVHLNDKGKEALELISKFEEILNELLVINKDPKEFISDYISINKNKIKSERDRILVDLNNVANEMIEKMDNFENESKKNLENLTDFIANNLSMQQNMETKYSNFRLELRTPNLSNTRLDELINDINHVVKETQQKLIDYKNKLLLNKKFHFIPKGIEISKESFGELNVNGPKDFDLIESMATSGLFRSEILTASQAVDLIELCDFKLNDKFNLIYRASMDGFSTYDFHRKCDGIQNTLVIVKVKGNENIFGGYTVAKWDSISHWVKDQNGFVFSLINQYNKPVKFEYKPSIYCSKEHGPLFGGLNYNDFYIANNSNENEESNSNLGFNNHHELDLGPDEENKFLAGSQRFSTSEIEIFERVSIV